MKIECLLDGKPFSITVNSNKPLSLILSDNLGIKSIHSYCNGHHCGNCIVLMSNKAVLSCLIPAFEIRNQNIVTFESFSKSRPYKDIEKAYSIVGARPCENCFSSKTLLIESIVHRYEDNNLDLDIEEILQETELIQCRCMDGQSFLDVITETLNIRRRRNVRRS